MYEQILVPADGSAESEIAIAHGIVFARLYEATIHGLYAVDEHTVPKQGDDQGYTDELERAGDDILASFQRRCQDQGVSTVVTTVRGDPLLEIQQYVKQEDIDLVVLGKHRERGLKRFLRKGLGDQLLRTTMVPILSVPRTPSSQPPAYESILLATDGRQGSKRAEKHAIDVAKRTQALLHAIYVVDTKVARTGPLRSHLENEGAKAVKDIEVEGVKEQVSINTVVSEGDPSKAILEYAKSHEIDLIVSGTSNREGLDQFVFGSVAAQITEASAVPVLTVPMASL